eukprot:6523137-Heterocapsa_arctica.AAC.1
MRNLQVSAPRRENQGRVTTLVSPYPCRPQRRRADAPPPGVRGKPHASRPWQPSGPALSLTVSALLNRHATSTCPRAAASIKAVSPPGQPGPCRPQLRRADAPPPGVSSEPHASRPRHHPGPPCPCLPQPRRADAPPPG